MSFVIEMPESTEEAAHNSIVRLLHQQVGYLIHHPEFNSMVIIQSQQRMIELALPKGQLAFIRDTKWRMEVLNTHLKITIAFLDYTGMNYMRGQSDRIKLQAIILLKLINSRMPIEEEYYLQPTTGIIRYTFMIAHKDYEERLKGIDSLRKLFKYILSQLNLYADVVLFCQGVESPAKSDTQVPVGIEAVNRYRILLRNTRVLRESGLSYMNDIIEIKQRLKQNPHDMQLRQQLDQIRFLFQNNMRVYEEMKTGIQPQPSNFQKIESSLKHIIKNAKGGESQPPEKIVKGIMVLKSGDIKSISKEGAHSDIMKGKFLYKLSQTINLEVAQSSTVWLDGKQHKTQLILKKCNMQQKSSVNSFMNEICLLNHLRDAKSSYIARYYLQVKHFKDRSEKDIIYMNPYFQNLYGLVKKCQTLRVIDRLSLAYKLSKGMCFLNYWEVLHRDFKPHNIMVDYNLNPVLIDFGSCAPIYRSTNFKVHQERLLTTRPFHVYFHQLPEQYTYLQNKFTREEYNRHPLFDVYSFGRVLSYLFFNSITPPSPDDLQSYPYPELLKNILFLITICLQIDPDERPAFAEITSFLGTLQCYVRSLQKDLDTRTRSFSEPKRSQQQQYD